MNGGKPLTLAVFSCSQYQAGKHKFLLEHAVNLIVAHRKVGSMPMDLLLIIPLPMPSSTLVTM